MTPTVNHVVEQYRRASEKLRQEIRDPAKAREFLLRAGIAERVTPSSQSVRLAKRFR